MAAKNKKNTLQIIILAAAIAGIAFFALRLRSKGTAPLAPAQIETFSSVIVDSSVLRGEDFKNLRAFGPYPLRPGKMGRENPFIPPSKEELSAQSK